MKRIAQSGRYREARLAERCLPPDRQDEVDRLQALNAELLAALLMVRDRWTFDTHQQHTHSWHDWADCKSLMDAAITKTEAKP